MNGQRRPAVAAAEWLSLAAAPTFVLMAFLTAAFGDPHAVPLCSQPELPSPLSGMTPMYLLMAAFHLVPWFRLMAGPRG